jgi:hypothetical protein
MTITELEIDLSACGWEPRCSSASRSPNVFAVLRGFDLPNAMRLGLIVTRTLAVNNVGGLFLDCWFC